MKKIAVLIEDSFNEFELIYPYYRLKEAGYDSVLVGPEKKAYHSKAELVIESEASISEINFDEFSGVVIPGGYAPDRLRRNQKVLDFVRDMFNKENLVAAICHGGWVLISAEVVNGVTLTGFYSIKDDLKNAGAKYTDEEVVVDGNLITSRGPKDLPVFMREIIKFLDKG
ncbi:MAG: type 1 glutamine amidotransferase [Caldisericaceae bacterium]|nr:type 1 glutamine amidotransferase [Caldisericaceae bacterium]